MYRQKLVTSALRRAKRRAIAALAVCSVWPTCALSYAGQSTSAELLPSAQLIQPADLVRELASPDRRPTIVYVGFRTLFAGGHIPGATFHGSGSTEQGLADLKKWAAPLPRTTNLVIYCGCCPFQRCPNIRPAFALLRDMGFTRVRVLELPTNFAADWVDKGYPTEKGLN